MSNIELANDWAAFPIQGSPSAPRTGPFPFRPFLETVWNHRTDRAAELVVATDEASAVALAVSDDLVQLVGEADLTDYHAPVGPRITEVLVEALSPYRGRTVRFDSLPLEATPPVMCALELVGTEPVLHQHDQTAVLDLPPTFDEWLMGIGKKERHEVRRKQRRFEAEFGPLEIVLGDNDAFSTFCAMHRNSEGEKGLFMTPGMQAYFGDLTANAGAVIHELVCGGRTLATAFGWETEDGYFYYNSAFDPAAASASPGVVLFTAMIETEIRRGATVFDFLKGNETYKFRHGAVARPLYTVEGQIR